VVSVKETRHFRCFVLSASKYLTKIFKDDQAASKLQHLLFHFLVYNVAQCYISKDFCIAFPLISGMFDEKRVDDTTELASGIQLVPSNSY